MTPIDIHEPLLTLAPASIPIIELWGYPSILEIFNMGLLHLPGGKIKSVLYSEKRMTTMGITKVPEFEERFRNYGFDLLMRDPGRYIEVLGWKFYAVYKEELQR